MERSCAFPQIHANMISTDIMDLLKTSVSKSSDPCLSTQNGADMIDFRQMRYFVSLFEEGAVTRAARKLNIVQPALSMQISKLEQQIGQKLFERTSDGMVPTESAKHMYRLLRPLLSDLEQVDRAIRRQHSSAGGHLKVGIVSSIAHGMLPEVIRRFEIECPNVSLSIEDGYSDGLIERTQSGRIDLAFVNLPKAHSGLIAEPVLAQELALVSSVHQFAKIPNRISFERISELKLVLPSKRHGLRSLIDQIAASKGLRLVPKFEIDVLSVIADLVERSDAVSLLPPIAIRNRLSTESGLRQHQVVSPRLLSMLGWVHQARRPLNSPGRKFIKAFGGNVF
jgi:LysR family transcriptional regulator, nitrogen assimilation regulatory protein